MNFLASKRMRVSLLTGAALGLVCILGALARSGFRVGFSFLLALWFNRLLMGLVFGLLPGRVAGLALAARGASLGLFISFAFFSATGFGDWVSFLAGLVYGLILELVIRKYGGPA
ncbi:MAG: hypothetical protein AB9880_10275 [Christensenellales bacterium]